MARRRSIEAVRVLTFEEKTRFAHFFTLLVEIDLRLPKSTKAKTRKHGLRSFSEVGRATRKTQQKPVEKEPSYIKCPAMRSSRTAQRDLFLQPFTRIFNGNKTNSLGYCNDRYYSLIAYT